MLEWGVPDPISSAAAAADIKAVMYVYATMSKSTNQEANEEVESWSQTNKIKLESTQQAERNKTLWDKTEETKAYRSRSKQFNEMPSSDYDYDHDHDHDPN
jgi:hypothetical protein